MKALKTFLGFLIIAISLHSNQLNGGPQSSASSSRRVDGAGSRVAVKPDPGNYDINNLNLMLYLTNFYSPLLLSKLGDLVT